VTNSEVTAANSCVAAGLGSAGPSVAVRSLETPECLRGGVGAIPSIRQLTDSIVGMPAAL
jgi:hypothetical protein